MTHIHKFKKTSRLSSIELRTRTHPAESHDMAAVQSLAGLLNTLQSSLSTLSTTLPLSESLQPPIDGISLLDTKNELFLSYLQNLVFLILLKLRDAKSEPSKTDHGQEDTVADGVVKRLVELRVYLDRGVKPLENKLRYQIDNAVRAADEQEARSRLPKQSNGTSNAKKSKQTITTSDNSTDGSHTNDEDSDISDSNSERGVVSSSNIATFTRPSSSRDRTNPSSKDKPGVYRPPRIAAVAPPTMDPKSRRSQRPQKSHLLDEYITSELADAPVAEPSIGTNILDRGRRDILSTRERKVAQDRQQYEEENLIRLPGAGKKEVRRLEGERAKRGQFGGEEWSGLGGSADRIVELTRSGGGTRGVKEALERSRKRGRNEDGDGEGGGGGSGGSRMGNKFVKKRRELEKRSSGRRQ